MPAKISLFVTCLVDQLFPAVGLAMADVLQRAGYLVDFREDQTCCGQPAFNSGHWTEARQVAKHFLDVFRDSQAVVVPSGSCAAMLTHHMEELFRDQPARLAEVLSLKPRIWEFSQFLTEAAEIDDVGARFDGVVTFHDSCHALRELKVKDGPRRLLGNVKGLTLKEMEIPEECCGFGGTFSVKFPEVSGGMARTKIEAILKTGASAVVAVDSSCLMQLQGALQRGGHNVRTLHLAEVLASK